MIPSRGGNKTEATTNLVHYLGAANMLQGLHESGNNQDIQHLIGIMENKVFNITLSPQGVPQPARDAALLDGLRSANQTEKAIAIATFVYQVRCNDTHGEKAIDNILIKKISAARTDNLAWNNNFLIGFGDCSYFVVHIHERDIRYINNASELDPVFKIAGRLNNSFPFIPPIEVPEKKEGS